jgi:hypothetical protein
VKLKDLYSKTGTNQAEDWYLRTKEMHNRHWNDESSEWKPENEVVSCNEQIRGNVKLGLIKVKPLT